MDSLYAWFIKQYLKLRAQNKLEIATVIIFNCSEHRLYHMCRVWVADGIVAPELLLCAALSVGAGGLCPAHPHLHHRTDTCSSCPK